MLKAILNHAALALVAAAAVFASCDKQHKNVAVESVKLDERALLLYEGESQILKAIVSPVDATDASVRWSTDNPSVATVSDDGFVTAVAAGEANVTATTNDGGKTATCAVTVKAKIVSVSGVTVTPTTLEMLVGDKQTLQATVTPANASNTHVSWSVSPQDVVSVSQSGEVEALKTGSATITVTTADGGYTASCSVTVDASSYVVTFETNGGSEIAPVTINKGEKLAKPADPTKEGGLDGGLYAGTVDPDQGAVSFGGWYTDEALTQEYDFNSVPTSDFTLYAKWNTSGLSPIDVSGTEVPEADASKKDDLMWLAFQYLKNQTFTELTKFTFVIAEDNAFEIGATLNNPNVEITVVGKGGPRTISHNMSAAMFRVEGGHLILGKNVTISGNFNGYYAILLENDGLPYAGNVTMLAGSKITNCTAMSRAAAVYNNNGSSTFTLDGGEISNNVTTVPPDKAYGGAMCANWGAFIIKSGKICDNETYCSSGTVTIGGAGSFPMYNRGGKIFEKTGGVISGNKAAYTDGATGDEVGQQVIIGNHGRRNERGIYKIDADLGEGDNVSVADRNSNPLWIAVHKVE